jgi:cobalt-zinc-cadmium efflux system membrane fusion protein
MKTILIVVSISGLAGLLASCGSKVQADPREEAPPAAVVVKEPDSNTVRVDHPEQFPLATATPHRATEELSVTGQVSPDVSLTVPVPSLASGRVVEVNARLGDEVTKGQVLTRIRSTDVSQAFSDYRKAMVSENLSRTQLDRAKLLYGKGAIAKKDVDVAQSAEDAALVDVQTAREHLTVLGANPDHPGDTVDIIAPASGVITDQQVTVGSGVQALTAPNPFTISDLSTVWIMCDVYENDLPKVHVGEYADIRLNAYPDRVWRARISKIMPILDPNLRTAKVRLELHNPGLMRLGMFVTATFHSAIADMHASVPASAVLHLHDRDWVYMPDGSGEFRRVEVDAGGMLPGNMQEIRSGVKPGDQVVSNALVLQSTVEQ